MTSVEVNGTEDFLIIACDGLWDTVTPKEAAECVFDQLRQNKGEFTLQLRKLGFSSASIIDAKEDVNRGGLKMQTRRSST